MFHNEESFASESRSKQKKATRRKRIIIGGVLIFAIIVIVVALVLIRSNKNAPKTEEDIPDAEVPEPPSPSVLHKFLGGGAVVADDKRCAEIGKKILERHGSAMDAALATAICNGMPNMQNMGLGGAFVLTYYNSTDKTAHYLNARDRAPLAAHSDMYRDKGKRASVDGALSVAVPGEVAGYWAAHQRFGKLPWADLFKDSIELCRKGWELGQAQYEDLRKTNSTKTDPILRSMFWNETSNDFKKPGELIKSDKLCDSMEIIAKDGVHTFYNGSLGQQIINDLQAKGGILTMQDLNTYSAKWDDTLSATLSDGSTLYTSNFPSSGALLIFIMNILDDYGFTPESIQNDANTTTTYHRMIEAFKYAYAARTKMGDPDYLDMTDLAKKLTSKPYAKLVKELIKDNMTFNDPSHYNGTDKLLEDHGTSHISVLSPEGDAVSMTSTMNTFFGSGFVSPSTGILLNNGMDDFSIPSVVNYYGLPGNDKANFIAAGKRPVSSMVPSILVDREGHVKMVIGSAGGTKITTSTAFVMARTLWMKNTIKEAIDAPRIHHQFAPMELEYQFGVMKPVIDGLKKLGHVTKRYRARGSVVCAIIKDKDVIYANADYRRSGGVAGLNESITFKF